ncbi:MAG: hypothetical protein F4Y27_10670, partial [Acidimicrobiaceae bacterium]|nr:hypothetical protein [Acidimicrobiaceae bacterium]
MTLSRGDNMVNRGGDSNNIQLYSHMTLNGYKQAHWNPGVGLWQLDNFARANEEVVLRVNVGLRVAGVGVVG